MNSIIPFEQGALPAFLKGLDPAELNADLTAHAGGGFPVISIKGKVFAVTSEGERKILRNPLDPESAATSIDMVIIKANAKPSKIFYMKGFVEGEESKKPDCWSPDGEKPDPSAEHKQSKVCATCKHNAWGSKIDTRTGEATKGKACQDSVRMAVARPDQINEPYLIRVPPASIRPLGEFGKLLKARGVGYNMVLTKIGFDMEAATPKLTFKPIGFIDEKTYAQVKEMADSEIVKDILGSVLPTANESASTEAAASTPKAAPAAASTPDPETPTVSKDKEVTTAEIAAVLQPTSAPAPVPAPAPKPVAEVQITGLDLDSINFDD